MRRRLVRLGSSLIACLAMAFPFPMQAADGTQAAPKLLNLFLDYQIADDDPAKLAKWDIVVLDMDEQFEFPDKVREIKRLNPNVKILAYVSASEISDARFQGDPTSPGNQLARSIPEAWFLHHANGSHASVWAGNSLMNATDLGASVNGQRWNTFLGPFIRDHVLSSGLWDGVFLDAAYGDLTSTFGTDLDPDGDGRANPAKQNDEAWVTGMKTLMRNVRAAIGPDKLIMNNSSATYASLTNGVLFENFPRYGWAWPFAQLQTSLAQNKAPKISAVNTNTDNQERADDYRLMRYGLSSAMIADGYFSFDAGDRGHHRTWWYDEYDAAIGNPVSTARVVQGPARGAYPAVWQRQYDHGVVLVNATTKTADLSLAGEYERLTGTQDPKTNSGEIVNRVTVPPQDGVILLKRGEASVVTGSAYVNGTFMQVYDAQGNRMRNGFFASRDGVPGGANTLVADVDRDGTDDVIFSQSGQVTVQLGRGGAPITFRPYGTSYRGGIELATGQANGDAPWELILAPTEKVPATILVTTFRGAVLHKFLAYRKEFIGGASVAIGDLDGDGKREIVTGPGRGGGPHVRTFKTDGGIWSGGFFAFDATETGGANIAVGDVDGDGKAEIIVGSGPGAIPRIRVYAGNQRMKSEFSLGTAASPVGVKIVVADIDGDGKAEILVPGNPF